ncbi:hypothetical protein H1C71_012246, partial [Ictidomys tridecemlineatus]
LPTSWLISRKAASSCARRPSPGLRPASWSHQVAFRTAAIRGSGLWGQDLLVASTWQRPCPRAGDLIHRSEFDRPKLLIPRPQDHSAWFFSLCTAEWLLAQRGAGLAQDHTAPGWGMSGLQAPGGQETEPSGYPGSGRDGAGRQEGGGSLAGSRGTRPSGDGVTEDSPHSWELYVMVECVRPVVPAWSRASQSTVAHGVESHWWRIQM